MCKSHYLTDDLQCQEKKSLDSLIPYRAELKRKIPNS